MLRGAVLLLTVFLSLPAQANLNAAFALLLPSFFGVVDGRTDDEYAKLLKIDRKATIRLSLARGNGGCTGRMLTPTTLLTAAHCVDRDTAGGEVNVEGVESVNWFIADDLPDLRKAKSEEMFLNVKKDLAIVVFPEGTGEFLGITSYAGIAPRGETPKEGYVVGYGDAQTMRFPHGGAGAKRWGHVNIVGVKEEALQTETANPGARKEGEKAGDRVAALMGDSGGAVHAKDGSIIGVVSVLGSDREAIEVELAPSVTFRHSKFRGWQNYLVDASSDLSRALYKKAIQCDKKPCAGNFAGSGIPNDKDNPVLAKSPEHKNQGLFTHLSLRAGRYKHVGGKLPNLHVAGHYNGNTLESLWVIPETRENETGPVQTYVCSAENCAGGFLGSMLLTIGKGNKFSTMSFFAEKADEYVLDIE